MRVLLLLFLVNISAISALKSQIPDFQGKQVGLYISSRSFQFSDNLYLPIAQFLSVEEDRSGAGRLKAEFLIRIGWMLQEQLQPLTKADSVHFLNADLPRGKAWQAAWDMENNAIRKTADPLSDLDYVVVIHDFDMKTRAHRSVFIRSNRMITEKMNIKHTHMYASVFSIRPDKRIQQIESCYDDQRSGKPKLYFNFFQDASPLGKFISQVFSQWWIQALNGTPGNCKPPVNKN